MLRMFRHYAYWTGAAAVAVGLIPPTLDWDDETNDNTPDFTIDFGPDAIVGDVIRLQYSSTSDFASVTQATDTLDSAALAAGLLSLALSALADGTYYMRARLERGGIYSRWSNTETVTISGGGGSTAGESVGLLLTLTKAA